MEDKNGLLEGKDVTNVKKEPNPVKGLVFAILLGIVAAIFWAIIVKVTGYNIGLVAIAVGFLVSQGFVWAGKSDLAIWGVVAAVIAGLSIFLGKILVVIIMVAEYYGVSFFEMLPMVDFSQLLVFIVDTFEIFDLVFYAIALQTAYKRSFIKPSGNYADYLKPEQNGSHSEVASEPIVMESEEIEENEENEERTVTLVATSETEAR